MIVLGILIMGGTGTVSALLVAHNFSTAPIYTPQLLGHSLPSLSAVGLFCAGLGFALLFCLGIWMIAAGVTARHRRTWNDSADDFLPGDWQPW